MPINRTRLLVPFLSLIHSTTLAEQVWGSKLSCWRPVVGWGVECLPILFQIWRWGFQGLFHHGVGSGGAYLQILLHARSWIQLWLVKSKKNCLLKEHNSVLNTSLPLPLLCHSEIDVRYHDFASRSQVNCRASGTSGNFRKAFCYKWGGSRPSTCWAEPPFYDKQQVLWPFCPLLYMTPVHSLGLESLPGADTASPLWGQSSSQDG